MSCFLVIGDLGGTNIRLDIVDATVPACLPRDRDAPHSTRLLTRDFASFEDALRSFTAELPAKIADSLCGAAFAVCGPVVDGRAACLAPSMGPNGWSPTSASVAEALGLPLGAAHLVNDFVAVGLAAHRAAGRGRRSRGALRSTRAVRARRDDARQHRCGAGTRYRARGVLRCAPRVGRPRRVSQRGRHG